MRHKTEAPLDVLKFFFLMKDEQTDRETDRQNEILRLYPDF